MKLLDEWIIKGHTNGFPNLQVVALILWLELTNDQSSKLLQVMSVKFKKEFNLAKYIIKPHQQRWLMSCAIIYIENIETINHFTSQPRIMGKEIRWYILTNKTKNLWGLIIGQPESKLH